MLLKQRICVLSKLLKGVLVLSIIGYLFICVIGKPLVSLLGGNDMLIALPYVLLLCINVVFTTQTYFLGNTVLVIMGKSRYFNLSIVYTSIMYILLNSILILTKSVTIWGLVATAILAEVYCVGYRWFYVRKFKLLK